MLAYQASLRFAFLNLKVQPTVLTPSTSLPVILAPQQALTSPRHYGTIKRAVCSAKKASTPSKGSITSYQLRAASTTTVSPPPPASPTRPSSSPKTPALEPASTSKPAASAESTPSGTIPTSSPPPDPTTSYAALINSSPDQQQQSQQPLAWNDFLRLRHIRRRFNLISSIILGSATTAGGAAVIADGNMETFNVMGLDPMIVMGFATLACGAVGWLIGPVVGTGVFGGVYRKYGREMAAKEKDLFQRIKKQRADPSNSSSSNPVPDYYGEKIGSVAQYRTWLKDQKLYNRRKEKNFV